MFFRTNGLRRVQNLLKDRATRLICQAGLIPSKFFSTFTIYTTRRCASESIYADTPIQILMKLRTRLRNEKPIRLLNVWLHNNNTHPTRRLLFMIVIHVGAKIVIIGPSLLLPLILRQTPQNSSSQSMVSL